MFRIIANESNRVVAIQISRLKQLQKKGIRRAFYDIGDDLQREAKKNIASKVKSGVVYRTRIGGRIIRHQASAPGEAPANLTGKLRKSVDFTVVGSTRVEFGYRTIKNIAKNKKSYGKFLEEGTRRMGQRPNLIKAIRDKENNMKRHFETQIKKQLSK